MDQWFGEKQEKQIQQFLYCKDTMQVDTFMIY